MEIRQPHQLRNRSKLMLTLVLLFLMYGSYAQLSFQNGFIINLDNDTIPSQIAFRLEHKNYLSCIVKDGNTSQEYLPEQLLGYGFEGGDFYSSEVISGEFVQVLVAGKLSLYKSKNKYHVKKDSAVFDLESNPEKIRVNFQSKVKGDNKWRGLLTWMISDCLDNASSMTSSVELEDISLIRLVSKYNDCAGGDYVTFYEIKDLVKVSIGGVAGITRTTVKTNFKPESHFYLKDLYQSIDPFFGMQWSIRSPQISERVELLGEILLIRSSYSYNMTTSIGSDTEYHKSQLALNVLSFPVLFNYAILQRKDIDFYVSAGFNYDRHLNSNSSYVRERVVGSILYQYQQPLIDMVQFQMGTTLGGGINRRFQKFNAGLGFRYYHMSPLNIKNGKSSTITTRMALNLIIQSN